MDSREKVSIPQQFQTIDDKTQIITMLTQCCDQQSDLHASLSRKSEMFTTRIEKIDTQHDCLFLAELLPKMGQRLLRGSEKFRVYTHVNGSEINFEVEILRVKSSLFRTRNCVRIPNSLRYFQRRRAHRVHISMAMDVHASINTIHGNSIQGQIRDLSATGMRIQFYRQQPQTFDSESVPQECLISLPNDENIRCRFTIHHLHQSDNNRGFAVGGSFASLNSEQKKTLQRFLAKVERESLRAYR